MSFAAPFYANRTAARGFVRAYIRASRLYQAALAADPGAADRAANDESIARHSGVDLATVREMVPVGLSPNGLPNRESLLYCYGFFRSQGLIPEPVSDTTFAGVWGTELVDEELSALGRVPE